MKIGFYNDFRPCILKETGVVDISREVQQLQGGSPQLTLENIIVNFQFLRPRLERLEEQGTTIPLSDVRLRPPVPRLAFVIGKAATNVPVAQALDHIFGYTTSVDVSARAPVEGEATLPGEYGKSFDTFLPIGPAITTADEIKDPNNLNVKYRVNGDLRQDYNTSDMEHSIAYLIAALSANMTLKPGDLILCGTNHQGLGPLQDGDVGEIEIEGVGRSSNNVVDSMKRTWSRAVDPTTGTRIRERRESQMGVPSTGTWPLTPPSS